MTDPIQPEDSLPPGPLAEMVDRFRVVATSLVTLMITLQTALTVFAASIADSWPDGARGAVIVAGAIGSILAIITTRTPVPRTQWGILPRRP